MKALWMKLFLLLVPPLILLVIGLSLRQSYLLFPQNDLYITPYCDGTDGAVSNAASTIDSFKKEGGQFSCTYTLRKGYPYPYAGVSINPVKKPWDLSSYDYLEVCLQSPDLKTIRISLQAKIEHFVVTKECEVSIDAERKVYRIPLSDFQVPSWWYSENGKTPETFDISSFNTIIEGISFENPSISQLDVASTMIVENVEFHSSVRWFFIAGGVWGIVIGLVLIVVKLRTPVVKTEYRYEQVVLDKPEEHLFERLEQYIGAHFTDTELTIAEVSKQVGVTPKKLAALFRAKCDCTFKQYLNTIRLNEAYRLITEEDHSITQIFLAVGFNSSSYFNRLFAKEFQQSPTELRRAHKRS